MMLISSSEAVKNIIGTLETCRTFSQNSKPVPSGNDTSKTSNSYLSSPHNISASFRVLAIVNSYPCFLKAKESPLIKLKSSSRSSILLMFILLPLVDCLASMKNYQINTIFAESEIYPTMYHKSSTRFAPFLTCLFQH